MYLLRDETGKVRYVGKGRPARAQVSAKRRNLVYEIVAANLPEEEARALEWATIGSYGLSNLDNVHGPREALIASEVLSTDTHAALLRSFIERHDLTRAEAASLLGLPDPERGGRITITRWVTGQGCGIPLEMFKAALVEMDRRLAETNAPPAAGKKQAVDLA